MEGARELEAQEGIDITASCMAHFLRHHLPLTAAQRAALDSACQIVTVREGRHGKAQPGLSRPQPTAAQTAEASRPQAEQGQDGGGGVEDGRRTRAHCVDAADLESLRQVAHGRIFTCKMSSQTAEPALAM